jgi:hypothetical protein
MVYVPQVPTRYDAATEKRVPSIDLNPALHFGQLRTLASGPTLYDEMQSEIEQVRKGLIDITPEDYILCTGDPILVAAAIARGCELLERVSVLRWDKRDKRYEVVKVSI